MRYIYLVLFLAISSSAIAAPPDTVVYKNRIHFSPLRVIGLVNPGWEVGYERMVTKRYSAEVWGAILTDNLHPRAYDTYSGFRLGAEAKRFHSFSPGSRGYLSLETIYNHVNYTSSYLFFPNDTNISSGYRGRYGDTIGVYNRNLSLNFKAGLQTRIGRFMIDCYCGLGIKYKYVTHSDRLHPDDRISSRHPNIYVISAEEMKGATLNIPLNFTVAYCF